MTNKRSSVAVSAVFAVAALVLSGCAAGAPAALAPGVAAGVITGATDKTGEPGVPIATAKVADSGPGSLVSATTIPGIAGIVTIAGASSAHVLYRSTNGIDGSSTQVTGSVFMPGGNAPQGGWPVIAYGHGTTGIQEACAPSLSPNLLGITPLVASYAKAGYAVVVPDYQGLGAPGVHPYLDAKTAGLNMIDAVRAVQNVFPNQISNTWAAFGGSQGGGAAWAADEQATTYAPDLNLVGAAALAPPANLVGFVQKAATGTLTTDQGPAMQWILQALKGSHPDLNLDDYRSGVAAENWDVLSQCSGPDLQKRTDAAAKLGKFDFAPKTPEAAATLTDLLQKMALPQQKAAAPLFIIYGSADTLIDAPWTTAAIAQACALGDTIQYDLQQGKGHGDVDSAAIGPWIAARFAGTPPAQNDCPAQ